MRGTEIQRAPAQGGTLVLEMRLRVGRPTVGALPSACVELPGEGAAGVEEFLRLQVARAEINHRGQDPVGGRGGQIAAQQVGTSLDNGAGDGVRFAVDPRQAADHRQEHEIGAGLGHAAGQPLELLHRGAEGDVGLLDAALERGVIATAHHRQFESQIMQEGGEERKQALEHELIAQRHGPAAVARGREPLSREARDQVLDQCLPFAERIRREVGQLLFARALVVQGAAAAPGEDLAAFLHHGAQAINTASVAGRSAPGRGLAVERVLALDFS